MARTQPATTLPDNLRSRPTQARSRATFDKILKTAAELLHDIGYEGFNTNLLAKRADCRVSTIYRYFPDKNAIILVLAEDLRAEWRSWLVGFDAMLEAEGDLIGVWLYHVDLFFTEIRAQTAGLAIRQALLAAPDLQRAYREDLSGYVGELSDALQRQIPSLAPQQADAAAFVLITSTLPVLDQAEFVIAPKLRAQIAALKDMHRAYLSHLLAPGNATPSG